MNLKTLYNDTNRTMNMIDGGGEVMGRWISKMRGTVSYIMYIGRVVTMDFL